LRVEGLQASRGRWMFDVMFDVILAREPDPGAKRVPELTVIVRVISSPK